MSEILIPIFICVVLPVAIVLIIALVNMNADNKRAQVLLKALEANNDIDTDKLAESLKKAKKSAREILNLRLLRGCIFSFLGIALIIISLINFACGTDLGADAVTVPMIVGGSLLAIGASYLTVFFATRKQVENPDEK